MKHLLTVIVFLTLVTGTYGTTWFPANQKTLEWDPVTKLEDGTPLPQGSSIEYDVWYKDNATGLITMLGQTADTSYTVTFTIEGKYWLGVRSIRVVDGESVSFSDIYWTSDPANCQSGEDFGVVYYRAPGQVGGLRAQ